MKNNKIDVTPDLEVHEEVHSRQQGENPSAWWHLYLTDPAFRLQQEIEAYGTQLAFAQEHVKNRHIIAWLKENLAQSLSSELYGNLLTPAEAESKIRNYAKTV